MAVMAGLLAEYIMFAGLQTNVTSCVLSDYNIVLQLQSHNNFITGPSLKPPQNDVV